MGRGDQADTAADETTVTKGLDHTTATTESVVEPTTRTKEAPILEHVEQQLESQVQSFSCTTPLALSELFIPNM